MFECFDVADVLKSVEGKVYPKNEVVEFTIKEVKENKKYANVTVSCLDKDGSPYTFMFGTSTPSKKKQIIAFLSAFFTREQLIAKTSNPVELVGQRFEAKSDGQREWEGKQYQQWSDKYRKVDTIASAEEFTS
jgi:hypothetical protein